jgi:hypothetical protein
VGEEVWTTIFVILETFPCVIKGHGKKVEVEDGDDGEAL